MVYTFPFDTCEVPTNNAIIAQPVSFAFNFLTAIFLSIMAIQTATTKKNPHAIWAAAAIASYALFEFNHAYSHMHHIQGALQMNIVHVLGYIMAMTTLLLILKSCGIVPWRVGIIIVFIAIDIWFAVFRKQTLTMVATGLGIFAAVFISYFDLLPAEVRKIFLSYLAPGLAILMILFINEARNCEAMITHTKLPYHAMIEVVGLAMFVMLAWAVQKI